MTKPKQLVAGDIRCPDCGKGFCDIAPDYRLGFDPDGWEPFRSEEIFGHCENGHGLTVWWNKDAIITKAVR